MDLLEKISEELQNGNFIDVPKMTQEALDRGLSPAVILSDALVAGMDVVGEKFRREELFLPEVLIAAKAMQAAMAVLRPRLIATGAKAAGTIVIGTIQGDLHDIGKNLVGMLFEGAGYQVIDLGVDVAPARFVEAARTHKSDFVGLSAMLTTTMPRMREVIESLAEAGMRDRLKVMVGGAPVTEQFARDIGADGYAPDAASAVEKARTLKS
ncbi:MAG: corrinoid protein [Deltaproteobacteria bacterium]|nr:corrinoid protein [Deltaproteobacteria bacterium]